MILVRSSSPVGPDTKPLTWPVVPGQGTLSRLDAVLPAVVTLGESGVVCAVFELDDVTVIAQQEARRLVEDTLAARDFDGGLIIVRVQEVPVGWVYFYDSVRHQQTGSVSDHLAGNAPLLVDRDDGTVHETGTARPVEYYVAEYTAARSRG